MSRKHRSVLVLLIALILAGLWMWLGRGSDAVVTGPSPSQSMAARRAAIAPAPVPAPAPAEADPAAIEEPVASYANETVVVDLREAKGAFLMISRGASLEPGEFWPLPGEAPFPEGATASTLQELIADPPGLGSDRDLDFLDLAWEEGLDPDNVSVEDPWTAVLALEVARRAGALDAFEAEARAPDVQIQLALASDLIDAWPDHPAADYARLYQIDGILAGKLDDDEEMRSLALDLLRDSDDALVVSQALGVLRTRPHGEDLSGEDLDRLRHFSEDFPDLINTIELSAFALDQAMAAGDGPRTREWLDLYAPKVDDCFAEVRALLRAPNVEELLAAAPASRGSGSPCSVHRNNLDEAVAYVGDIDPSQADSWRQAFEIAGYHCSRAGHDWSHLPIRTVAHWEGTWSWETWDRGPTAFGSCFERAASSGPKPKIEAMDVRVAVIK